LSKKKITYIVSNIYKAIAFEWICEQLDKTKFEISFILLNNGISYFEEYLFRSKIKVFRIDYKSKNDLPLTLLKLILFLKKNKTEIVHTHLFDATFSGLIAAKLCCIKKRIYTRHYSSYHHQYFPKAVKWDKLNNNLATDIIAISEVVKDVLVKREDVDPKKISLIYHGFKLNGFFEKDLKKIEFLNQTYNPTNKRPVIGVISRFTELKGVQYIIPAFKKLLKDNPNALLLLFNASGDYEKELDKLLVELPLTSFKKICFENEIMSLYHLFDVFIHVPIDSNIEAFGQTYIECMASGVPLIATKSGIANEILINKDNSILVDYKNSQEIYNALDLILNNKSVSDAITKNALNIVKQKFELESMIKQLEALYLQ
jgi:glycosyltransferase involved in cell wall biosynthesis